MINHKHRATYIRVACTASSTLINTFRQQHVLFENETCTDCWSHDPNHMSLEHVVASNPTCDDYFKFTMVRNPYDRLVSSYHYYLDWKRYNQAKPITMSFSKYINNLYHQPEWIHERVKYTDQYTQVNGCDYVGRFEALDSSYHEICEHLNIQPRALVCTNHTDRWSTPKSARHHESYREYYDSDTRILTALMNEQDLQVFNYDF